MPQRKLKRHELQLLLTFGQESCWSKQLEPEVLPSPVLLSDILCNIILRSAKGHVSNVLASENHHYYIMFIYLGFYEKSFPLKVHLSNL